MNTTQQVNTALLIDQVNIKRLLTITVVLPMPVTSRRDVFTLLPGTISQGMLGKMAVLWMWAALARRLENMSSSVSSCFTSSPISW